MQNAKTFPIISLALVMAALAANHLIARVGFIQSRRLSIESFPRAIGQWKAGPDLQTDDPAVKKEIPTAHIVGREYTRPDGRSVNLTLVTATEYNDLHNPMHCLPAAGWEMGPILPCQVGEDVASSAVVTKEGAQMEVLYWYTASTFRRDSAADRFRAIRTAAGGTQGQSLLVRLMTPKTPDSKQLLEDFAKEIESPLEALKEEARSR